MSTLPSPVILGPCTLFLGDCLDLLPIEADTVITDPPFSARTHTGHGSGLNGNDGQIRSNLSYLPWTPMEVFAVCGKLPSRGWTCFITDHTLAPHWEAALRAAGRYVFAPIPVITPGRSVRLNGDGPSSWTDWMIVARTARESKWGTLPGLYEGMRGTIEHMGGKPINAMHRIVEDYSRTGDTVLDFCMGSGTTGIACIRTGRKFIGVEKSPEHFATAVDRIKRELEHGILPLDPALEQPRTVEPELFP